MSQAEFSSHIGIAMRTYARLEGGETERIDHSVLMRLVKLGYNPGWLLGLEAEPQAPSQPNALAALPSVRRAHRPLDLTPPSAEVAGTVGMAWSILESGTSTAQALELNVNEFYEKVFGGKAGKKSGNG